MKGFGRADPGDYARLPLRAHELLASVPLHDVWRVELPGGGGDCTIEDVRALMSAERLTAVNPAVRALFALRGWLGRVFGWDRPVPPTEAAAPDADSLVHRLGEGDLRRSRVAPGTADGPFRVVFVHETEAISEIRNATVHAFSVLALSRVEGGHRAWWAIYVAPVGRITRFYMALIDPFRRFLVYPAILRQLHRSWRSAHPS